MQLRAARLCLDCEELFVGDRCPVCASEHYAFLTTWLPVEERRRWRRPKPALAPAAERRMTAIRQFFANLFGDGEPVRPPGPPRTRASDHVPDFNLDTPAQPSTPKQPAAEPQPLKSDVR